MGFAAPVMAALVLRESGAQGRFKAGRDLTPLVGRDERLALLKAAGMV